MMRPRRELALDFFIHDGGRSQPLGNGGAVRGDTLTIGGPRGSLVVPEDYAYQVYVCDESGNARVASSSGVA
ncbi:siderophore-interacting protein [Salmonella enterica subsp. arizonae]|uniref:Siderophore-interacting protein n=1 Tax=Salmonella enterica subsp. arizonae TaxID=59203 RepID=A0A379RZJ3_SALER|nr:siderophore-interacting protein [Salmonella enterica subsp. arizonae]